MLNSSNGCPVEMMVKTDDLQIPCLCEIVDSVLPNILVVCENQSGKEIIKTKNSQINRVKRY
jgi:hypothetical protein